jgi:hypothetical protein
MRLEYCRIEASKHDKDSFLAIIPETFGTNSSLGAIELSHPYGFASRPVDKDAEGGACGAYYAVDGAQGYAWLANDGRIQNKLPEILEGESFQYGPTGNFVRCHKDGRVSMFTTDDATINGRTVALTVGPDGLVFNAPWGNLKFDATGFHVLHSSGARIDLGACGGLPAPLDALSSYATISAALTHVEGAATNLGASSPSAEPAAKATQTVIALQSLSTALLAAGTALTAIGAVPINNPASGAITAAVAAVALAQVAITSSVTLIPSVGAIVA